MKHQQVCFPPEQGGDWRILVSADDGSLRQFDEKVGFLTQAGAINYIESNPEVFDGKHLATVKFGTIMRVRQQVTATAIVEIKPKHDKKIIDNPAAYQDDTALPTAEKQ